MSDEWKVKSALVTDRETVLAALTGGFFQPSEKDYVVENVETGETRHVTANDRAELGRKIARGDFDD